jgi:hypothetical protein
MDRREFLALGLGTHAIRARVAAITLCISCFYHVTHVHLGADDSFFVWAALAATRVVEERLADHARYAACGDRGTLGMFDVAPA